VLPPTFYYDVNEDGLVTEEDAATVAAFNGSYPEVKRPLQPTQAIVENIDTTLLVDGPRKTVSVSETGRSPVRVTFLANEDTVVTGDLTLPPGVYFSGDPLHDEGLTYLVTTCEFLRMQPLTPRRSPRWTRRSISSWTRAA